MGVLLRDGYERVIEVLSENELSALDLADRLGASRPYTGQVLRRWYAAGALERRDVLPENGVGRATYLYRASERALEPDVIEACFTRAKKLEVEHEPPQAMAVEHRKPERSVRALLDSMPSELFTFTVTAHGLSMTFEQGQRVLAFVDALRKASDAA